MRHGQNYVGIETEYGLGVEDWLSTPGAPSYETGTPQILHQIVRQLHEDMPLDKLPGGAGKSLLALGSFLQNGARLYIDVGAHPEYCTPPVTDLDTLLAHDIAGERILTAAVRRTLGERFVLNKRVSDERGETWGYHENYLVRREDFNPDLYRTDHKDRFDLLSAFLVTRTLFCGAGAINGAGAKAQFVAGQKASGLNCNYSLDTTHDKPVINLRDEPLADKNDYVRLHITCGDPHMSPWAQRLQIGSTQLVLAVIADGARFGSSMDFELPFYKVANQVSADISGKESIQLANGSSTTALKVQQQFLNAAKQWAQNRQLTPDQQWVLEQWDYACRATASEGINHLRDRAEWPARLRSTQSYLNHMNAKNAGGESALTLGSRLVLGHEVSWDQINNPDAMGFRMRQKMPHWRNNMPHELAIQAAMTTPPPGLATLRGRFVEAFHNHPDYYGLDWNTFWGPQHPLADQFISVPHPHIDYNEEVDAMIAGGPITLPRRWEPGVL